MSRVHKLEEFNLLDAKLQLLRPVNQLRDLVIALEISRVNITDAYRGSVNELFSKGTRLYVDLVCYNCYWLNCEKRFNTAADAHSHLQRREKEFGEKSETVWDYGSMNPDESERLRYWRALLGRFVNLEHWNLSTGTDSIEWICEELSVVVDPERFVR